MCQTARQYWQIGQYSGFYTGEGGKSTGSSLSSPEKSSADGVMSPLLHLGCSMLRSRQTFSSVELRRGKEVSESLDQHQSQGCLYHIFWDEIVSQTTVGQILQVLHIHKPRINRRHHAGRTSMKWACNIQWRHLSHIQQAHETYDIQLLWGTFWVLYHGRADGG